MPEHTFDKVLSAQPAFRLPDGQLFPYWEDETRYTRTLFVDQAHPQASDANPGTEARPFRTINKAAQQVKPGEKVVVKSGVYREMISPASGGHSPDQMICYEAAPGAKVVIKGSRILNTDWERTTDPSGTDYSFRIWHTALPADIFPTPNTPFNTPNASNAEIDLMPWALQWKDRLPYTLPRGVVFQNGKRMIQLATCEDLVKVPGSYWVDRANQVLYIHPLDGLNPNQGCYEVTVQEHLLKPSEKGLGYIRLRGFIFEHAGNGFPRVGVGAVYVYGGHHWIIEDNVVRHCNSVGIEAGARIEEAQVSAKDERARVKAHVGGFIIRGNTVYDCGTGGIEGHTVRDTVIEDNHIHHIGWQDVERYWECAAIKTLCNVHTLVRGNRIHDVASASAIWLDWDNKNCRITQNLVYNIQETHNGAVFIEASRIPNMIDHNIIWNVWRSGVTLFDSDNTQVCHNLIAHANIPVLSKVNTDRSLNGVPLSSKENTVQNNIFYGNASPPVFETPDNFCDHNVYGAPHQAPDLGARENPTWDVNSTRLSLCVDFDFAAQELTVHTATGLPNTPRVNASDADFFANPRADGDVYPGPFKGPFAGSVVFKM